MLVKENPFMRPQLLVKKPVSDLVFLRVYACFLLLNFLDFIVIYVYDMTA